MMTLFRESSDIDMPEPIIRRLVLSDAEKVALIEEQCFAEPWSANAIGMLTESNAFGIVCEADGAVAAYGGMICVLDEGQITNIATLPSFRRRGLAKKVLLAMLDEARERKLSFVTLEVRESNFAAIALYEQLGFFELGKRPNFYRKPTEAAVIMEKKL